MMTYRSDYKTTVTFTHEADNGSLEDFPATEKTTITFDATDLTVEGWVYQFKRFLLLSGFCEKTVEDRLG